MVAKGEIEKAEAFLSDEGEKSFDMWLDRRTWNLKILMKNDEFDSVPVIKELTDIIRYNYTIVESDF